MAKAKPHLVWKHLERISARIFEEYREVITAEVQRENGVYALYKDDRLYYVGLAKNLKSRLGAHLRDKHKGNWNYFSVYLTSGTEHMRELEALLLRIAQPTGNAVKGKLKGSTDLKRSMERRMKEQHADKVASILGKPTRARALPAADLSPEMRRVAKRVSLPLALKAVYKGKTYRARLRRDGQVAMKGGTYTSLSSAAVAITGRPSNGWQFWTCERGKGNWVELREMKG